MANNDIKDIALRIGVTTTGADQVNLLADQLEALAKEGSDAAPRMQVLADELRQLGQQDAAVTALGELETEIAATSEALATAGAQATTFGEVVQAQSNTVENFRAEQTELKAAISSTATEIRAAGAELNLLRATTDTAGKAGDDYRAKVISLKTTLAELQATQAEQKAQLADITAATNDAAKALTSATRAYDTAAGSAEALSKEMAGQNATLAEIQTTLADAGISATTFAEAEAQLGINMAEVRNQVVLLSNAYDEAAASALALEQAQMELTAQLQLEAEIGQDLVNTANARAEANLALGAAMTEETRAQNAANLAAEEAVNGAFGALGIRSLEEINAAIEQVDMSLLIIKDEFLSGAISAQEFQRAVGAAQVQLAGLAAEAEEVKALPGVFESMSSAIGATVTQFGALGAAIGVVSIATRPVIELAEQIDNLRRALTTITGSSAEAERQLNFLRDTANNSGLAISSLTESFVQFTASARTAGISADDTQKVFASVANAAGNLGLSSDKASHILLALGQMANKGTVAMEELRRQLGESLPGALGLLSKGLGITEPQLIKLVESGQLLASQALVPLANALTVLGSKDKEVEGLSAAFARLQNAARQSLQEATDSTAFKQLAVVIDSVASNFGTLVNVLELAGKAFLAIKIVDITSNFLGFGKAAGVVTAELTTTTEATIVNSEATNVNTTAVVTNTEAKALNAAASRAQGVAQAESFAGIAGAAPAAEGALTRVGGALSSVASFGGRALGALGGLPGVAAAIAINYKEIGTAIGEGAARLMGWGKAMDEANAKLAENARQAKAADLAQQSVNNSWVQANAKYTEALVPLQTTIIASTKLVEAKKLEGEAITRVAALTGSEAEIRQTSIVATTGSEKAVQALVTARQAEVDLTARNIGQLEADGAARGSLTAAEQKQLETKRQTLQTQSAELTQAQALLESTHSQVVAAQLSSDAYKDNSNNLATLKDAFQKTADAAALYQKFGAGSQEMNLLVSQTAEAAAIAQNHYRDALNDAAAAAQRQVQSAQVYASVTGENAKSLQLSATAAQNYADKLSLTTDLYVTQAASLRTYITALQEEASLHGDPGGKIAADIAQKQQQLALTDTEIDKSRQMTQASKDEAAARTLASEAYKDNSDKVGQYGQAARAAADQLARIIELQKEGKASADTVAEATRAAAMAEGLYKDALADSVTAIQNKTLADSAAAHQTDANISLALAEAKTQEALAKAKGDETAATAAQVTEKHLEAQARQANVDAMVREANNEIALVEQQRAEATAEGTLTPAKKAELDAREANAKAKLTEADAGEEEVKQIYAEADALGKLTSAQDANATSKQAAASGADRTVGGAATNAAPVDIAYEIQAKLRAGTLTAADLSDAQAAVKQATASAQFSDYARREGFASAASNGSGALLTSAQEALQQVQRQVDLGTKTAGAPGAVGTAQAAATPTAGSTSHTVNINIGSSSATISVASSADATALTNILQQLQQAATRAS